MAIDSTYAMFQKLAKDGGSFICREAGNGNSQVVSTLSVFDISDGERLKQSCLDQGVTFGGSTPSMFIAVGPPDKIKEAILQARTP